jgi:hypothetical protein
MTRTASKHNAQTYQRAKERTKTSVLQLQQCGLDTPGNGVAQRIGKQKNALISKNLST